MVAIAELGLNLSKDATLVGFLEFLALFVPVWWTWTGFTFYANRFDTDDLFYRLLVLLAMFAVAALATTVPHAFAGGSRAFAVAYVCVRIVLVILYLRARRHVEQARELSTLYGALFAAGILVWSASLLVAEPLRYWLWATALAVELVAPLLGWRLIPAAPIHPRHIPERFGLLTLIVLGESVIAVVLATANVSWEVGSGLAAAGGFVAAAALWWVYFDFLDSSIVERSLRGGFVFLYAHFPIVVGLAAIGVGVKLAILSAGGVARYDDTAWILCAGVALTMVGMAAVQFVTPPTALDLDVWLRLGTAALALVVLPFSGVLPPLLVVLLLAGALAAQVLFELAVHEHSLPGGTEAEL